MPRPKRLKVAPSAPAPRVRKAAKTVVERPTPQVPKAGFNDMYDVSDPEERVGRSAQRVKKNNGKAKAVTARGQGTAMIANARDLGREESLSEPGEDKQDHDNAPLQDQGGEAGIEDIDLDSSSPSVEMGRRERSTPAIENSLLALGNFRRRPRQPSILGRAVARARSSSVESNLAQDNGLTSVGRRNNSVLGNYNRHSRQASIGLDRDTPAKVGSALKLGNFKRRAREPSILRTAQKDRQPRPTYDDDDDEDNFNPDDESTPLNVSKARSMATSPSGSTSNPRKRKLSAAQVTESRSTTPPAGDEDPQQSISASRPLEDEEESEDGTPSLEGALLPSIEVRAEELEPMSETMAPPLSSSPTPESPPSYRAAQRLRAERERQPRGRRRLRDQTPPPQTQDSPISSPPSLTHSPNFSQAKTAPKTQPRRQAPSRSTFSTAQLQALLPRRRRRGARDPFDIPSDEEEVDISGLGSDEDELTHSTIAAPPQRSTARRTPAPVKKRAKPKAPPKLREPGPKQTYGSRPNLTSDKENEEQIDPDDSLAPLPDDEEPNGSSENSQELEKRVGKELKRATRKFEEVDKWELEFEEVTASSSSPKDAR